MEGNAIIIDLCHESSVYFNINCLFSHCKEMKREKDATFTKMINGKKLH